ncbi:MAG: CpaF family protein [Candidatus Omnitrophica bacterium]|nr:CpaF family protein [Candidatus Omnitrophota bacterium]
MGQTLKDRIRQDILTRYSNILVKEGVSKEELGGMIRHIIESIINRPRSPLGEEDKKKITEELVDEFVGLGPIEKLMQDPAVTEIMINGPNKIYFEANGKKKLFETDFGNESQVMRFIQKILAPTRRRVDESYPYTDVSLEDGSRINIIIPPLALDGPTVTVRKFLKTIKTVEDLIKADTMDRRMADFLVACIKAKANIMFTGATGAGKTTTLGILSSYINSEDRIVTIEDTAELHLAQEHVVRLEARQPNIEGKGGVTIKDLFNNSLRMRPERIILGEIRGVEALDMLQAICSGHVGSLSVLHANSPQDAIYRLETIILASGVPINLDALHRQIAAAINVIVQQEQLMDGSRKITHITQVNGLKDGRVVLEDIFVYDIEGVDAGEKIHGRWKATGVTPVFTSLFKKEGIKIAQEIFNKD